MCPTRTQLGHIVSGRQGVKMKDAACYLLQDGGVYYYRTRIPQKLRCVYSKKQLKRSLRTKNRKLAISLACKLHEHVVILLKKAEENMLEEPQVDALVNEYVDKLLQEHERGLALKGLNPDFPWDEYSVANMQESYEHSISQLKQHLRLNDLDIANDFIVWLRQNHGLVCQDISEEATLKREFVKRSIEAFGICLKRLDGDYGNEYDRKTLARPSRNIPVEPAQDIPVDTEEVIQEEERNSAIGNLIESFVQEKISSNQWRPNTQTDNKAHLNAFCEWFGENKPVSQITRDDILNFREQVLKRLPLRRKTNPALKSLNLREVITLENIKRIGEKTINGYLITISSFMEWCILNEYIERNPATSLSLDITTSPRDERAEYSDAEIERAISLLASMSKTGKNGAKNIDRMWIILLAAYDAMRENEICQLMIDDIICHKGIPCVVARKEPEFGQHTKTSSSTRMIPIHPDILKLGFLDFVNRRRGDRDNLTTGPVQDVKHIRHQQVFQSMTYSVRQQLFTKNFKSFFAKFKFQIIAGKKYKSDFEKKYDESKTFHSFRHSCISKMNNRCKIPYVVKYLDGHSLSGETDRRYTKPDMAVILAELAQLNYGFDLCNLLGIKPRTAEEIEVQKQLLPFR